MRLLLDEHFSSEIARQLRFPQPRRRGGGRASRAPFAPDDELFARMAGEQRAIVTNDVPDYVKLSSEALSRGDVHFGLLLVDECSMLRSRNTIGLYVGTLDTLLEAHAAEDALRNQLRWLP